MPRLSLDALIESHSDNYVFWNWAKSFNVCVLCHQHRISWVSLSSIYLSIYLSIRPPVCSSIRMSVFFIHPFIHLSCSLVPVHNLNSSYDFIQMVILKLFKEIVLKNTETIRIKFRTQGLWIWPGFCLFPMLTV